MSKADKIKARAPRGFADRTPADLSATERMLAAIRESYELYGFEGVETPFVEYTDALGKFLPDQDRPNEGVFSFQDDDEQWLSLRYDLTAPLARYVAENFDALPKPYRSYRVGWVFRNEKPGPGRFRQFMQFDADTVGAASVAADAEICMMAADTLEKLGLKRGEFIIKINNRKVLDGVLEAIGLGGEAQAAQRLTVLRAIDKLDRLGPEGVSQLLGAGRKDESGDFTKGAELSPDAIARVLAFTAAKGADNAETVENLRGVVGSSSRGLEGVDELAEIAALVAASGYEDRVTIDPSVVRGLEYYTGPVYEAELTFQVQDEDGRPVRFGSVGGGGRYDGLVGRFRSEPVPATGFSIGVSRLLSAPHRLGLRETRPGGGARYGPGPDRRLSAHGLGPAPGRHPLRALSRLVGHEGADEVRRPPPEPLRDHPGLQRARARRSGDQGPHRRRQGGRGHRLECRMEGGPPGSSIGFRGQDGGSRPRGSGPAFRVAPRPPGNPSAFLGVVF